MARWQAANPGAFAGSGIIFLTVATITIATVNCGFPERGGGFDFGYNEYGNGFQPVAALGRPIIVEEEPIKKSDRQDFSKIPGVPGVDFPIYHKVPPTSFSCAHVPIAPGMYANVETGCQAYHVCHDGREGHQGASFLCTNGTLFNQQEFACDWWYNVNCADAPSLYSLNLDPAKNPYVPKRKPEEIEQDSRQKFKIAVY